jgi:phage tail sheath protein FI
MPAALSYPGVYIEEIPSGVRTITGVPTSVTAFIGRAPRGEDNKSILINSFADYERRFGGLHVDSMMSYAVRDFYQNGGSQALIIRVHNNAKKARLSVPTDTISPPGTLVLKAASRGRWGNKLEVEIDHNTRPREDGSVDPNLFNLTVTERLDNGEIAARESHLNVSTQPTSSRYLPRVLENESSLVRVERNSSGGWDDFERPDRTIDMSPPGTVKADGLGTDGGDITEAELKGSPALESGIYALLRADIFNLLCAPPPKRDARTPVGVYEAALQLCRDRRAMLIVDPDPEWGKNPEKAVEKAKSGKDSLGLSGTNARNAALFFPCVRQRDPLRDFQLDTFVPSGIVAGVMARTDTERGVWKAPAGLDAALAGVAGLQVNLTDLENGELNKLGINCLRSFPVTGRVVWGSRTLRGADQLGDEYKYVPVRRLALYIEESLYRGTQWVVFEPNDEPLWAQIRLNIGAFMQNLFRQGAFQGKTPNDAYRVKCDKETTTQNDINLGVVNILVAFAPLKPAEFVVIKIQQLAGQVQA